MNHSRPRPAFDLDFSPASSPALHPAPVRERRIHPRAETREEVRRLHPALRGRSSGEGRQFDRRRPDLDASSRRASFCRVPWNGRFVKAPADLIATARRLNLSDAEAIQFALGTISTPPKKAAPAREVERPASALLHELLPVDPSSLYC